MTDDTKAAPLSDAEVRLRRLWKGTLLVAVAAGYAFLASLLLVQHGWRSALLALFFIVVAVVLRYIGNDVDRIGWNLSRGLVAGRRQGAEVAASEAREGAEGEDAAGQDSTQGRTTAMRYQARFFRGLWALAQVVNGALIAQALLVGGADRALATAAGLALLEVLFWQVRRVNHSVTFAQASYGIEGRLPAPAAADAWDDAGKARLNRKLDKLAEMAEAGLISQKAHRKARDKWLVRSVMEEDAGIR